MSPLTESPWRNGQIWDANAVDLSEQRVYSAMLADAQALVDAAATSLDARLDLLEAGGTGGGTGVEATWVSVDAHGAIGDGGPHPLSERYATLAAAQAVYPAATALTEQIDRHAVQKACDTAVVTGLRRVFVPQGTYLFDASVTIASTCTIFGVGKTSVIKKIERFTPLVFTGSRGAETNLTGNVAVNDRTLTVPSAGFAAGDYVCLRSNAAAPNATNTNGRRGEIVHISGAPDAATVSLYGPTADAYVTTDVARIGKITWCENPNVHDLAFTQDGPLSTDNSKGFVRFIWTRGARIRDCYLSNGDQYGVEFYASIGFRADDIECDDFLNDASVGYDGYGTIARGPSRDGVIAGLTMRRGRHAFTTGSEIDGMPRHVTVAYGVATEMTAPAWDTHGDSQFITFASCEVHGNMAYGFQVRDDHCKLLNPIVEGAQAVGIFVRDFSTNCQIVGGYVRNVWQGTGADATGGGIGIAISGGNAINTPTACTVYGTRVEDTDDSPILVRGHYNTIAAVEVRNGWRNVVSGFRVGIRVGPGNTGNVIRQATIVDTPSASAAGLYFDDQTVAAATIVDGLITRNVTTPTNKSAVTFADVVNVASSAYGAKGDLKTVADAAITATLTALASATAGFVPTDVNKAVIVMGAGVAGAPLQTTIATYVSATQVTLAAAASTTVTGASMSFGTENRAAFVAALNVGGRVYVPTGRYFVDTTAGALPTKDGLFVYGDGKGSVIVFGPEAPTTARTGFQINANVGVRMEQLALQGPAALGAGGSFFATNAGAASASLITRGVVFRLATHAAYASGAGALLDIDGGEIEGRGGTEPGRAIVHDGTSGDLRANNVYIWNVGQTGQAVHSISATTGVNLDVNRCRFGTQFGTGQSVYHFDTLGSAPTANTLSRIAGNWFSAGLTGTAVRTPYQGVSRLRNNVFALAVQALDARGRVRVNGCDFLSSATTAFGNIVGCAAVTTPLAVQPEARITDCTFTGRCTYAIFATTDLDIRIVGNDFLVGDATVPCTSIVRIDSGAATTSRIDVRQNNFAGRATAYAFQTAAGINVVEANRFTGNYAACIGSQGGTPARLSVLRNDLSPSAGGAVTLTAQPTAYEARGNYGSTVLADVPGDLLGLNTQTGTTYTLAVADGSKIVEMNNAAANTVTVPPNASVAIPIGWSTTIAQYGAGALSVAAGAGVTIRSRGSLVAMAGQYGMATLIKRAADEWYLGGDLA